MLVFIAQPHQQGFANGRPSHTFGRFAARQYRLGQQPQDAFEAWFGLCLFVVLLTGSGRGPWDYKQKSREYEAFGNFNYGVTGIVLGIPESVLLRAAGAAQKAAGTSRAEFGDWWGDAPYGDDHSDQHWIKEGIEYARAQGY